MSRNDTQPSYPPELSIQYTIGFVAHALGCVFYGIYVTIAAANLILLREKRYRILFSFTLLQLVITTLYLAISMYSEPTQLLSMFGLFGVNSFNALSPWNAVVRDAAFLVNTWASDAFLLCRCHVIWRGNKSAVALPALIYLATIGASIAWLTVDSVPGAVYSTRGVQVAGTAVFSCSVAMNVTASVLISGRLLFYRRAISQAAGPQQGRFYLGYIAMTLESAMLYTVSVIITLATFTTQNPLQALFFSILAIVQVIAPSLIVYRIARGISFETDGHGGSTFSAPRFASGTLRGRACAHDVSDVSGIMQFSFGRSTKSDLEGSNSFMLELGELKGERLDLVPSTSARVDDATMTNRGVTL